MTKTNAFGVLLVFFALFALSNAALPATNQITFKVQNGGLHPFYNNILLSDNLLLDTNSINSVINAYGNDKSKQLLKEARSESTLNAWLVYPGALVFGASIAYMIFETNNNNRLIFGLSGYGVSLALLLAGFFIGQDANQKFNNAIEEFNKIGLNVSFDGLDHVNLLCSMGF